MQSEKVREDLLLLNLEKLYIAVLMELGLDDMLCEIITLQTGGELKKQPQKS